MNMKLSKSLTRALILGVATWGGLQLSNAHLPLTASASTVFSTSEVTSGPTGYFYSPKAQFSFYWKTLKSKQKRQTVIVLGDFKTPSLRVLYPVTNHLSKDQTTFTVNYRMINSKGKLGTQEYYFPIQKLTAKTYRVKLGLYKKGQIPNSNGQSYTFQKSKTSPANHFAWKYTYVNLKKRFQSQLMNQALKQYSVQKAKGKQVANPSGNTTVKKQINRKASAAASKTARQMIKGFSMNQTKS